MSHKHIVLTSLYVIMTLLTVIDQVELINEPEISAVDMPVTFSVTMVMFAILVIVIYVICH